MIPKLTHGIDVTLGWRARMGCVFLAAFLSFPNPGCAAEEKIRVIGSDTLFILNQELAAAFNKRNSGVVVEVQGGGTGRGISALVAGTTEIAAASRLMKDTEVDQFRQRTGRLPLRSVVALDGLAIFIHERNPIGRLSVDQLGEIFAGKIRNWSDLGGPSLAIEVYSRNEFSGTREFFAEAVLKGRSLASDARIFDTTSQIHDQVAANVSAIGYGGVAYSAGSRVVRVVSEGTPVEGIWPSAQAVASRKYPLSRDLAYYFDPRSRSEGLKEFLRFALSKRGQEIVRKVGFYAIDFDAPTVERRFDGVVLTPANSKDYGFKISVSLEPPAQASSGSAWLRGQTGVIVDLAKVASPRSSNASPPSP